MAIDEKKLLADIPQSPLPAATPVKPTRQKNLPPRIK
jgi:hypothetical protein